MIELNLTLASYDFVKLGQPLLGLCQFQDPENNMPIGDAAVTIRYDRRNIVGITHMQTNWHKSYEETYPAFRLRPIFELGGTEFGLIQGTFTPGEASLTTYKFRIRKSETPTFEDLFHILGSYCLELEGRFPLPRRYSTIEQMSFEKFLEWIKDYEHVVNIFYGSAFKEVKMPHLEFYPNIPNEEKRELLEFLVDIEENRRFPNPNV